MKIQLWKRYTTYGALVGLLLLTGCDTVKEKLGLSREAPDEFEVMSRAPLEMPPADYNIRPPRPGAPRPQDNPKKVLGIQPSAPAQSSGKEKSQAEIVFLKEVHAEERNEDIRDLLVEEQSVTPPPPSASFMSTLAQKNAEESEVLDPTQAQRIKDTDQA